ncbi:MAG: lspA [Francisellaceae bacterium]|nr:lspA [Francisellaceae bacterium]
MFNRKKEWVLIILLVLILDQYTKTLSTHHLGFGKTIEVFNGLKFQLAHNYGAAFSFLNDAQGWQRWFFIAFSSLMSLILGFWIYKMPTREKAEAFALSLILGGAIGNLWDRILYGYVIDFIVIYYKDYAWPTFNIADSAITIGGFYLSYLILFATKKNTHEYTIGKLRHYKN